MILRSNNICYRELGSLPLYRFCVVAQSSKVLSVACTREPNYSNRRRVLSLLQSNSCGGYKLLRKCFDAIKNPMRRGGGGARTRILSAPGGCYTIIHPTHALIQRNILARKQMMRVRLPSGASIDCNNTSL